MSFIGEPMGPSTTSWMLLGARVVKDGTGMRSLPFVLWFNATVAARLPLLNS